MDDLLRASRLVSSFYVTSRAEHFALFGTAEEGAPLRYEEGQAKCRHDVTTWENCFASRDPSASKNVSRALRSSAADSFSYALGGLPQRVNRYRIAYPQHVRSSLNR
jgi:hypothetical protein